MLPLTLQADQLLQEVIDFNTKLAGSFATLRAVGEVDVGASSKDAVYREDKLVLYRYRPLVQRPARVPIMVVYALVNRPYMVDLQEDRSLVRRLLEAGQDVYLIDWGYPDGADRFLDLDDYINGYIRRCADYICHSHKLQRINVLGICQGGTFSLCFAALHPERVKNLITMVTPVDFQTPDNLLGKWARELDANLMVDTFGNVPGELLNWTFLSLKPFRLTGQKYADMVDMLDDPEKLRNFLRMEKWIFDSPDQAGEAFREFITYFYQQNVLINGTLSIGPHAVDLKQVTMPVFNVYATADHLVPPASSIALKGLTGTADYSSFEFKGGHIGIYVSGRSQRELPAAISEWLNQRA